MIKSMTGYGKARCGLKNRSLQVEVRSFNGKYLDVNFRIPQGYREMEPDFRALVSQVLKRGKIEVAITEDVSDKHTDYSLNKPLFKKYYRDLKDISEEFGIKDNKDLLSAILRLPDILIVQYEGLDEAEWNELEKALKEALQNTDKYRISEGRQLEEDLKERISNISELLKQIEPFEKQRAGQIKQKIYESLSQLNIEYDTNRFEQEMIYYLEKIDINEEKVRLSKHIDYFSETTGLSDSDIGKKLGFIAQEIGREINTLGAKAYDANIQKIVIQMKDELEKIREQLSNVL